MELGLSLSPELLTAVDPAGRGVLEFLRPQGRAPDAASAPAPFELLLQMLGNRLPQRLPGGEVLPAGGSGLPAVDPLAPGTEDPATLDPTAPGALALMASLAPLALAPPSPGAPAADGAVAADSPTALADALPRALAGAPRVQVAVSAASAPAADTASAAAAGEPATSAASTSLPSQAGGPAGTPADLDALLALDAAARAAAPAAAEPLAQLPPAYTVSRARAPGVTPAERARSVASELAGAGASAPRAEAPPTRAFDLLGLDRQGPPMTAPPPAQQADAGLSIGLPVSAASLDAQSASPASAAPPSLAPNTGGATSAAAAQPNAQLPGHLGTPVDAHAARWHEALASRIHWIVDHQIGEAQIKLNPPELGALDVKISMLDDKTYVQMTAHTSAARDELAQSLPRLRELMAAGGLDLGGATVSGGQDNRPGYYAAEAVARALPLATDSAEAAADRPRLRLAAASQIDVFA